MVKTLRKKGEKFESFLRRHNQKVLRSKFLQLFRERQHHTEKITKIKQKKRALFGKKIQHNREYLQKIGKTVDDK